MKLKTDVMLLEEKMINTSKKKIIAIFAALLVVAAVALAVLLLSGDKADNSKNNSDEETVTISPNQSQYGELIPVEDSKYLWQYGMQTVSDERPSEAPTTEKDELTSEEAVTLNEPQTYYEQITNWMGESVTDENGQAVTEIHNVTRPQEQTEIVTDEDGEQITENLPLVGAQGERWAQGVSDGKKYTGMTIYLNGDYKIKNSSVMVLTMSENSGLINIPGNLVYNLSKGTCTIGTVKYQNMASVETSGGRTIVNLTIPPMLCPDVNKTTSLQAKTTLSTFMDANTGDYIPEFTVSVK